MSSLTTDAIHKHLSKGYNANLSAKLLLGLVAEAKKNLEQLEPGSTSMSDAGDKGRLAVTTAFRNFLERLFSALDVSVHLLDTSLLLRRGSLKYFAQLKESDLPAALWKCAEEVKRAEKDTKATAGLEGMGLRSFWNATKHAVPPIFFVQCRRDGRNIATSEAVFGSKEDYNHACNPGVLQFFNAVKEWTAKVCSWSLASSMLRFDERPLVWRWQQEFNSLATPHQVLPPRAETLTAVGVNLVKHFLAPIASAREALMKEPGALGDDVAMVLGTLNKWLGKLDSLAPDKLMKDHLSKAAAVAAVVHDKTQQAQLTSADAALQQRLMVNLKNAYNESVPAQALELMHQVLSTCKDQLSKINPVIKAFDEGMADIDKSLAAVVKRLDEIKDECNDPSFKQSKAAHAEAANDRDQQNKASHIQELRKKRKELEQSLKAWTIKKRELPIKYHGIDMKRKTQLQLQKILENVTALRNLFTERTWRLKLLKEPEPPVFVAR